MEGRANTQLPPQDYEEASHFGNDIWGKSYQHYQQAKWLAAFKVMSSLIKQNSLVITEELLYKVFGRMRPWKAPGADAVQDNWIKKFSTLHERIWAQLNHILNVRDPWMTSG